MNKVAIIGFGNEGQTSARYWHGLNSAVEVRDGDEQIDPTLLENYSHKLGAGYLEGLENFDIIVRTPGIHPQKIIDANPDVEGIADKITSSTNEFLSKVPTQNVIGVTGTKGKGTTTTIIVEILAAAGKDVHIAGNIGVPALDVLPKLTSDSYVAIELSSFQLYDLQYRIPTAVCLSVSPEHLNWHADVADYESAKSNIFAFQNDQDLAIYNACSNSSTRIVARSKARKIAYEVPPIGEQPEHTDGAYIKDDFLFYKETQICKIDEIVLPGRHNLENICAAITAVWDDIDGDIIAIKQVLHSFTGLHDHLELIDTKQGVTYYNDTYATAPDAAVAAMNAFDQTKVMILGGIDKKVPLEPFVNEIIAGDVRGVVLIDDLGPTLLQLFTERDYKNAHLVEDMHSAVQKAAEIAQDGDVVLMAPGCAGNGGIFIDKLDRGRQFNAAVSLLQ